MLNRAPIFLNCFARGGSNILWNIFLSHPEVCSPIRETVEIFRAGWRKPTMTGYRAILLTRQPHFFDQWKLAPRRNISRRAQEFIDATFHEWKMKTLTDAEMSQKAEGVGYEKSEVESARLVAKNNNGLVFLSDALQQMYPDAVFVGLLRDPFAMFESYKRRRILGSIDEFAAFYKAITAKMAHDRSNLPRYQIVRFEDIMADPVSEMRNLYAHAGLDPSKVEKLRFKAKAHLQPTGEHSSKFPSGRHYWFEPSRVDEILEKDINTLQSDRIDASEKDAIRRLLGRSVMDLGY